ncbi:DUF4145 domain-containing protein [Sphingomonas faeni]|uniref:DUF4145 domain-containing protein n=1 Tax=Sphingomonas faeni TaxID=185950 RepID=UPI001ABF7276|nr:DUF4145 domain-containing protein [Sphingomonas faeni]
MTDAAVAPHHQHMANISLLSRRFADLTEQLAAVEATKAYSDSGYTRGYRVDSEAYTNWKTKARHLLATACGQNSVHFKDFVDKEQGGGYSTSHEDLLQVRAVFNAAKEDFDGGYLNSVRSMVQAEVFSTELDQANELMKGGYIVAAAVIAGVVLETTMRRLCEDAGIEPGSLNKMNADLTKAGIYNLLVNKRITALADIRNNAAHGHPNKFTKDDVVDMIAKVEAFVADHV